MSTYRRSREGGNPAGQSQDSSLIPMTEQFDVTPQGTKKPNPPISEKLTEGKTLNVKLDLHTHIWEAFNFQPPSLSIAEKLIAHIRERSIDGIAITDHHNWEWGFEFRELVEEHFPG